METLYNFETAIIIDSEENNFECERWNKYHQGIKIILADNDKPAYK